MTAKEIGNKITDPDGNFRKWGTFFAPIIAGCVAALYAPASKQDMEEVKKDVKEIKTVLTPRITNLEDRVNYHIANDADIHSGMYDKINSNNKNKQNDRR